MAVGTTLLQNLSPTRITAKLDPAPVLIFTLARVKEISSSSVHARYLPFLAIGASGTIKIKPHSDQVVDLVASVALLVAVPRIISHHTWGENLEIDCPLKETPTSGCAALFVA